MQARPGCYTRSADHCELCTIGRMAANRATNVDNGLFWLLLFGSWLPSALVECCRGWVPLFDRPLSHHVKGTLTPDTNPKGRMFGATPTEDLNVDVHLPPVIDAATYHLLSARQLRATREDAPM